MPAPSLEPMDGQADVPKGTSSLRWSQALRAGLAVQANTTCSWFTHRAKNLISDLVHILSKPLPFPCLSFFVRDLLFSMRAAWWRNVYGPGCIVYKVCARGHDNCSDGINNMLGWSKQASLRNSALPTVHRGWWSGLTSYPLKWWMIQTAKTPSSSPKATVKMHRLSDFLNDALSPEIS